jgi:hypothetical protein
MGPELSLSIAVSIRQSPGIDGQDTGYCLPRNRYSPDQQGGIHQENCANRRGNVDSAIWQRLKS